MKKNDIFELEITDMGTDGEGIGHYDGMTFFVKDALIGRHNSPRNKIKEKLWLRKSGRD